MAKYPDKSRQQDDAALFEAAMHDVEALPGQPPRESEPGSAPKPVIRPRLAPPAPRRGGALPHLDPGRSADIDTRTLDRLKRGQLRPEARVDLHGMTQDQAHRALGRFLGRARGEGRRCVLVVTGKGRVSEGGGVLRNQTPNWLNAPEIRPMVLAFAPAQLRDGGSGALYVLLRRDRG
ncbi:MAG: Smr/MutS family protein [Alphaproteobacteria bacterium]